MQRFLVTLALGPVQSLIGAARRTRDLWCGSWLLSEAARAAARVLHKRQPGCLIFPCPEKPDADLAPQDQPGDAANIANVLRAEMDLPDAAAARVLCEAAKHAAAARLTELGNSVLEQLGGQVREEVWQAQIDDILEGFAAWVSIPASGDGYGQASKRLGGVLATRKATRDFRACKALSTEGLPKSSLDGAFETVLPKPISVGDQRKLRLSNGEQLDALGVIKRLAGDSDQFTAYARIAADPWVEQLSSAQQQQLCEAYEPLVALELATRTSGNAGIYRALPFDAQMLYSFRLDNELSQSRIASEMKKLETLRQCVAQISRDKTDTGRPIGIPVPYAAILKADGDRMGELLSRAASAEHSRTISRVLHGFASGVRRIVREHRGHAIYAGGDDVLALVPLAQAQECASVLAASFQTSLGEVADHMGISDASKRPTLSVGLGIGHIMEPLGALRDRAERAEKMAKGNNAKSPCSRNALAILLGIRSGAELAWRAQWNDEKAFNALATFTDDYRKDLLPTRAAYDLRGIDRRLAWLRDENNDHARGMREAEVRRMLDRARTPAGKAIPDELQDLIRQQASARPLMELADTLIIARWLSARTAADIGEQL